MSKVGLGSNQQEFRVGAVSHQLWVPFGSNIFVGSGGNHREENQKDIGLGVGEGPKTVVVFLTGGIPETEVKGSSINHQIGRIVIEYGGDVGIRECIGCVGKQ